MKDFNKVRIAIASPEKIREWSFGEVEKPETINYRTLKPEREGLFDERIFGPIKDYECACGKYKRQRYEGKVCERCGVEVTSSKVRRYRMGHIDLATPAAHIWYVKDSPSKIGTLLDLTAGQLEKVLYFSSFLVTDARNAQKDGRPLKRGELLSDDEYRELRFGRQETYTIPNGQEAVVGEFDRLGGDLGAVRVEARAGPAHRDHPIEVPGRDHVSITGHGGDGRCLPLHPTCEAAQPRRQLRAVLSDRAGELDVAVLDPGGKLPDEAVVAALFPLLEHHLQAQTFAGIEPAEIVGIDLDVETHADRGIGVVGHIRTPRSRWVKHSHRAAKRDR